MMFTIIISLLFFWQQSVNTSGEDEDEITTDEFGNIIVNDQYPDTYNFEALKDTDMNQLKTSLVITTIVLVFYFAAIYFSLDAYREF